MIDSQLVNHACRLLKSADPYYLQDAREGAGTGNTIVGSVMSLTTGKPRWITERAVDEALRIIDEETCED